MQHILFSIIGILQLLQHYVCVCVFVVEEEEGDGECWAVSERYGGEV